jgi:hypothetical protein
MTTIWVYKPSHLDYFIAKPYAFGFHTMVMDRQSAQPAVRMIQGVAMPLPAAWEWKQKVEGRTYAGFNGNIYDITELERPVFIGPR